MPGREPEPWTTVSSAIVFEHPFMTLVEDVVRMPTGREVRWLRYPDHREGAEVAAIVKAIPMDERGRVLVSRQYNLAPERVVHEFPAGGAEIGEPPEDAMRRELMEEVGLDPGRLEPLGTFLHRKRRSRRPVHIYLATDLTERSLPSDDAEQIAWDWYEVGQVEANLLDGTFDDVDMLAAWGLLRMRRPELFGG